MAHLKDAMWDEWSRSPHSEPPEDEIAGIIDGLQTKSKNGDNVFRCKRLFVIKRLMGLWKKSEYSERCDIGLVYKSSKALYGFSIKHTVAETIFKRGLGFSKRGRNWRWSRGLWGACGSLYIPKTGYYLVMRPPSRNGAAERMAAIMKSAGFPLGIREKNGGTELMLRDQQHIATFLSRLGFSHSVLLLEETAIYRSVRNRANKLVNCDSANINKSLRAAQEQLVLIRKIEDSGLAAQLSGPFKDLIFARKNNPSASLRELGQSLPIPISKSTVEYRWRKLESMMDNYQEGDGGHVFRKVGR